MSQKWDADKYAENARFVSDLGAEIVQWLSPKPGERILDLGCGDGVLTEKLVDLGCTVVGVDSSPEMVAAAKKRGLDARVIDGEALPFEKEFDAVFSNAALHWMKRPERVIEGVRRALVPQGRFVGEFGGHGNVAQVIEALKQSLSARGIDADELMPWYFPTEEEYQGQLEKQGFGVEKIQRVERPTPQPGRLKRWLETFAGPFLSPVAQEHRDGLLEEVESRCRSALLQPDGTWIVDYVRLRFAARKEEA